MKTTVITVIGGVLSALIAHELIESKKRKMTAVQSRPQIQSVNQAGAFRTDALKAAALSKKVKLFNTHAPGTINFAVMQNDGTIAY